MAWNYNLTDILIIFYHKRVGFVKKNIEVQCADCTRVDTIDSKRSIRAIRAW